MFFRTYQAIAGQFRQLIREPVTPRVQARARALLLCSAVLGRDLQRWRERGAAE